MARPQNVQVQRDSSMYQPPESADSQTSEAPITSDVSFYGQKKPPESPLGVSEDEYHMGHKNRGKAIIFNHEMYADNLDLSAREGTEADREKLQETFKNLGFVVQVFDNQSKKKILEKLAREQENQYHCSSDCLVVVVLTHGQENGQLFAHDDSYIVSELWAPFMADKCPALASKPKIFVIQACRGEKASRAVGVNQKITTDSIKMPDEGAGATFTIPSEADILVAYSTFEGRAAFRDTVEGTWYITELCEELDHNAQTDDVLTMLTRVHRRVALTKEISSKKQMPSFQSTLTRKMYFNSDNRHARKVPPLSFKDVHSKLDDLLTICKDISTGSSEVLSTTASSPVSLRKLEHNAWDTLRVWPVAAGSKGVPADEVALRHAKGLKMFLEWRAKDGLEDEVQENGRTLLTLMSWWESLDADTRTNAHRKTMSFLQCHAQKWPVFELLDVPTVGIRGIQSDGPSVPRARKTSRGSSQSSISQTSKSRPPFK